MAGQPLFPVRGASRLDGLQVGEDDVVQFGGVGLRRRHRSSFARQQAAQLL